MRHIDRTRSTLVIFRIAITLKVAMFALGPIIRASAEESRVLTAPNWGEGGVLTVPKGGQSRIPTAEDNGCADAAAAFVTGMQDPQLMRWVALCNMNKDRDTCLAARKLVDETGDQLPAFRPKITCGRVEAPTAETKHSEHNVQLPSVPNSSSGSDAACASYAASMVTATSDPDLESWAKSCNENPNVGSCSAARSLAKEVEADPTHQDFLKNHSSSALILTCAPRVK